MPFSQHLHCRSAPSDLNETCIRPSAATTACSHDVLLGLALACAWLLVHLRMSRKRLYTRRSLRPLARKCAASCWSVMLRMSP